MEVVRLAGFSNRLGPGEWRSLLATGDTNRAFLTRGYLGAWWKTFGRGARLLLAVVERGRVRAIAPLFAEAGMVFFIGSGGSDYLDFVGDVANPEALPALLDAARHLAPDFVGFRFYHVPSSSRTGQLLEAAARRLDLSIHQEETYFAPALAFDEIREEDHPVLSKKTLLRRERWFAREGELRVRHFAEAAAVEPHLEPFFAQHEARWAGTPSPSLFRDPAQREFYRELVAAGGEEGWLRFTRLDWNDRPIAFHLGFSHAGRYLWYKPSYEPELAKRSPGQVLLRQLLLAAIREGARTFDFGLGDEAFKSRFANRSEEIRTWGLYPRKRTR